MKELGWSEAELGERSDLSQKMINFFLNGERKLSPAASDRVNAAIKEGYEEKRAFNEAMNLAGLEIDPADPIYNLKKLYAMGSMPQDRKGLDNWKTKEIQRQAGELRTQRELNAALETELSALRELESAQKRFIASREKIISNFQEMVSLYKGQVEHLKQQLRDAGITPTDYIPAD
jgi:hypothetical protein